MPARHDPRAPVEFTAPIGGRVRLMTALSFAAIGVFVLIDCGIALAMHAPAKQFWAMVLAPLVGVAVVGPIHFHAQVRGYRLTADELLVSRRGRQTKFSLTGLEDVVVDPKAMEWSIKVFGNDGLGAITGRFRSKKLGPYEALVTDRGRAVVLRWPERCLVVSPDRPEEFAAALRARAGLRR